MTSLYTTVCIWLHTTVCLRRHYTPQYVYDVIIYHSVSYDVIIYHSVLYDVIVYHGVYMTSYYSYLLNDLLSTKIIFIHSVYQQHVIPVSHVLVHVNKTLQWHTEKQEVVAQAVDSLCGAFK
jgi:hypothetical protein